jgi:hypothetical protein
MNAILHFLRLKSAPESRDVASVHFVPRSNVQWGGPVFRAPALSATPQARSEVSFDVNFPSKSQRSR